MNRDRIPEEELDPKLRSFIKKLTELSKETGYIVAACGFCDSPWILKATSREGEYTYWTQDRDCVDCVSWGEKK